MGFIKRQYEKFKAGIYHTAVHTHFSIKPVTYTFITDMDFQQIDRTVEEEAGLIRNIRRYNVLMGYCRGNRLTLYKLTFSAKFLIMMRPFQAYLKNENGHTVITGSFRFSTSTVILFAAWMFNDFWRLITNIRIQDSGNIIGHMISLLIVLFFLARMVWKDKRTQNMIIDFMESKLNARWVREQR